VCRERERERGANINNDQPSTSKRVTMMQTHTEHTSLLTVIPVVVVEVVVVVVKVVVVVVVCKQGVKRQNRGLDHHIIVIKQERENNATKCNTHRN
jgi:hypothetical protein